MFAVGWPPLSGSWGRSTYGLVKPTFTPVKTEFRPLKLEFSLTQPTFRPIQPTLRVTQTNTADNSGVGEGTSGTSMEVPAVGTPKLSGHQ